MNIVTIFGLFGFLLSIAISLYSYMTASPEERVIYRKIIIRGARIGILLALALGLIGWYKDATRNSNDFTKNYQRFIEDN